MNVITVTAQEKNDDWMFNPKVKLHRNGFNKFWKTERKKIIGSDKIDSVTYFFKADSVLKACTQDSVTMTELVKLYREVLDLFTLEDPHFRIYPYFIRNGNHKYARKNNYSKYIRSLPFNLLQINDTLMIDNSVDTNFLKGDIILSINGIKAKDLLNYTYRDRYIQAVALQKQYHLMFVPNYKIELLRKEKQLELNTKGTSLNNYYSRLIPKPAAGKMYGNIGYIAINSFRYNKFIIKELRRTVKNVKKQGGNTVIIDLRKNGGGSGEYFDKLLSIFTLKSKINYLKSQKVLISEKTIPDYGYADSIGKLVTLPDSKIIKEIPLHPKLYMGKINYYILISMDTGSIASSFANVMQYNNFGVLAGEPMRRNATRYGEALVENSEIIQVCLSTVEIDEHTKAVNGIIKPDISIPYTAKEYAKGGDPVLEKLLEKIQSQQER